MKLERCWSYYSKINRPTIKKYLQVCRRGHGRKIQKPEEETSDLTKNRDYGESGASGAGAEMAKTKHV